MSNPQPKLVEIDLRNTTRKGGAGLEVGPTYLVMYNGQLMSGHFSEVWFGLTFRPEYGHSSLQYDPPGENYSRFQRAWRIENADAIAAEDEMRFAQERRDYAIKHKLNCNGQTIDETAPIEAFFYHPKVPAMPRRLDDEDDREEEA